MTAESAADLASFFDDNEHAELSSYTLKSGGAPTGVKGIFDNQFLEIDINTGATVVSQDPRFIVSVVSLPTGFGPDDLVVIDAVNYKAKVFEPDGTGTTTIVLEKQ